MPFKKTVRRAIRSAGRSLKRRYFKGKGFSRPKIAQMAKDVYRLKSMVNAEKKRAESGQADVNVALQNGAGPGYLLAPVLPTISQGLGSSQRTGNSIKVVSFMLRGRMKQQTSINTPIRVRMYLLRAKGVQPTITGTMAAPAPVTDLAVTRTFIENDIFTGYPSYNSNRNPDTFTDWIVQSKKVVYLKGDDVTGQTQITDFSIIKKCNFHVRYNSSGAAEEGNLFLLVVADSGDTSTSTGAKLDLYMRTFYYDN
jgi:hypothetical protein